MSKISVSNKLELFLIGIDEIFPMQSSEFTKSLFVGSNLKKKNGIKLKIHIIFSAMNGFL